MVPYASWSTFREDNVEASLKPSSGWSSLENMVIFNWSEEMLIPGKVGRCDGTGQVSGFMRTFWRSTFFLLQCCTLKMAGDMSIDYTVASGKLTLACFSRIILLTVEMIYRFQFLLDTCWEPCCSEHGIHPDGHVLSDTTTEGCEDASHTFFLRGWSLQTCSKCVMVGRIPIGVDAMRAGTCHQLSRPEQLISRKEESANQFARSRYTIGKQNFEFVFGSIHKLTVNCIGLQMFMVHNAVERGTESGLRFLTLKRLSVDHGMKSKLFFTPWACTQVATTAVEALQRNLVRPFFPRARRSDSHVRHDAVYSICRRILEIERPTYTNLNRLCNA
eukprot:TRINITY_DN5859_c0_g1_i1.p1 TRINITY_DN5859_c0_g1~~TRINITY_DN5859_c0_g1_i1.p1  ORF type:complete len:332 (-),score=32.57 TRINITY_DN5859_c0_g1_i1:108-1103(-)